MNRVTDFFKAIYTALRAPASEGIAFQMVWVFFSLIVIFISLLLFL
jgi:hypothetical protein